MSKSTTQAERDESKQTGVEKIKINQLHLCECTVSECVETTQRSLELTFLYILAPA